MIHLERVLVGGIVAGVVFFLAVALAWTGEVTGSMRPRQAEASPVRLGTRDRGRERGSPPAAPGTATAGRPPSEGLQETGSTHVVRKGETLWSIAGHRLGTGNRWRDILELNRDRVADPTLLPEGTVLRLP